MRSKVRGLFLLQNPEKIQKSHFFKMLPMHFYTVTVFWAHMILLCFRYIFKTITTSTTVLSSQILHANMENWGKNQEKFWQKKATENWDHLGGETQHRDLNIVGTFLFFYFSILHKSWSWLLFLTNFYFWKDFDHTRHIVKNLWYLVKNGPKRKF